MSGLPIETDPVTDAEQVLVDAVKAHALDHYETGGWDIVVEAYSDLELAIVLRETGAADPAAAIAAVGQRAGWSDSHRGEIQATAF